MVGSVVIVGAGEAGARTAVALRELGFAGPVTLIGDEPLEPYERPPLSKATLAAAEPAPTIVRSRQQLASTGIDFVAGVAVRSIDRDDQSVRCDDGREVRYQRLVLATGARPRALSVPGEEHAHVLRTFADALALGPQLGGHRRLVVIGAGFIGLEVAAVASAQGCSVVVLESARRVMARAVPSPIAELVADRHRMAGVEIRCSVTVTAIEVSDGGGRVVVLGDGSTLDCDAVVAGVGAVPNTELAYAAGLRIDNGIAVDARLRTDDPAIFAIGDCCSFPHPLFGGRRLRLEAWRNAIDQGAHVARAVVGGDKAFLSVPWFWSDQYELTLQIAGIPDVAVDEIQRTSHNGAVIRFGLDGEQRIVSASGIGIGTTAAKDIRIAEMLIAAGAHPDPAALADAGASLKLLLKEHT